MEKSLRDKIMEASRNGNFLYDSYWGNWSRVLSSDGKRLKYVDLDLTPIYGHNYDYSVVQTNIRAHNTQRGLSNEKKTSLPFHILNDMIENLGEEKVYNLLTYNFLPEIDWNLYEQKNNGGASFDDIRKLNMDSYLPKDDAQKIEKPNFDFNKKIPKEKDSGKKNFSRASSKNKSNLRNRKVQKYSPGDEVSCNYVPSQDLINFYDERNNQLEKAVEEFYSEKFPSYKKIINEMKGENFYNLDKFAKNSEGNIADKSSINKNSQELVKGYEMDIDFAKKMKKEYPVLSLSLFNNLKKRKMINKNISKLQRDSSVF